MRASTERDLNAVFPKMVEMRVGALAITADAFFLNRRGQIIALAARYGLPATSPWREAGAVVVMRDWAKANSDALVRYITAVVEGRRWLLDRANKAEAVQLLVDKAKLPPAVAARAYEVVTDPVEGFSKDAKFDMEGFKNVLKLRAEIEGQWGGNPPAPDKYIDLSYYNKALASL